MGKSIYSIVLHDDVVAEIDRLAYAMNTNRSSMINQILADYVSYTTPEKRIKDIFDIIERALTGNQVFQPLLQPSDSMFSLRSVLSYKYNPTVRYSVEIYQNEGDALGELRVSLRTQSNSLILYVSQFLRLWSKLEEKYTGNSDYAVSDGRYIRKLHPRANDSVKMDAEALGDAIARYIDTFDRALKAFFASLDDPNRAVTAVEKIFTEYLSASRILV